MVNRLHTLPGYLAARRSFSCRKPLTALKCRRPSRLGSEVIETGCDFDAARIAAEEYATARRLRYIHSANEPLLVAGVGTATLELLEAVPRLDVLFVPGGRR